MKRALITLAAAVALSGCAGLSTVALACFSYATPDEAPVKPIKPAGKPGTAL